MGGPTATSALPAPPVLHATGIFAPEFVRQQEHLRSIGDRIPVVPLVRALLRINEEHLRSLQRLQSRASVSRACSVRLAGHRRWSIEVSALTAVADGPTPRRCEPKQDGEQAGARIREQQRVRTQVGIEIVSHGFNPSLVSSLVVVTWQGEVGLHAPALPPSAFTFGREAWDRLPTMRERQLTLAIVHRRKDLVELWHAWRRPFVAGSDFRSPPVGKRHTRCDGQRSWHLVEDSERVASSSGSLRTGGNSVVGVVGVGIVAVRIVGGGAGHPPVGRPLLLLPSTDKGGCDSPSRAAPPEIVRHRIRRRLQLILKLGANRRGASFVSGETCRLDHREHAF